MDKSQEELNAERAAILACEGQYGKALQALTSNGMAPVNLNTETELRRLNPASDTIQGPQHNTDILQLVFTE